MKRTFLLYFAIFVLLLSSTARPIGLQTAQSIAAKFMATNDLQLAATYQTKSNTTAFYIFNTADGFVIVSADDCETPIVAYSHEGRFNPNNIPVQMEDYLQDFVARMQYGIENHVAADELTARQWELVKATGRINESKSIKAVAPLLTEKWHQGCRYNSLCPTMSGPCGHAEVGCVAVAMGQIMHYWKYPAMGWGSHSYSNAGTTLSANFGNTTYDWEHMPDSLTDASTEAEIEAVATLLYHCGVSVDMYYTINGSGANSNDVPNALRRYFNYSRLAHREKQSNYNNEEWLAMVKHDLDLQRPVLYSGSGDQGSHAFVCDGYDDNILLHFNWGWGTANGYFALGNLNPNGYAFNNNNYAIFDIIPHYDPCQVVATAYPSTAGTIEGIGGYHIGEQCTLTVFLSDDYRFYCWKKNGQIISNLSSVTFAVEEDTLNIEAHFSCHPVSEITASHSPDASDPNSPEISLSWNHTDGDWHLLKQFEISGETGGVATDGEYIYVSYAAWNDPPNMIEKYTMDGDLVEAFDLEGIPDALCLVYDGNSFYCNSLNTPTSLTVLYQIDIDNRTVIDSTAINLLFFGTMAYDSEHDGFWLCNDYQTHLYNRQGQRIQTSPSVSDYIYGSGYYTAHDETPHLLLTLESGVYDYDINNNVILGNPLLPMNDGDNLGFGACTAKYDDKDALIFAVNDTLRIYEIESTLAQIIGYRIYRADSEGNTVMLADHVDGSDYIDNTWNDALAGMYRFGISMVFANGVESETIWSEFIEKTDYGIGESNDDSTSSAVQKVVENGQIIIIKDGKRYSIMGQQLN
jgi:hypothetical protein